MTILRAGTLVAVALVACGQPSPPAGMSLITGGIAPCRAIPLPTDPRYAAGTVVVLRGAVSWRHIDAASEQAVFPDTEVARETVTDDQTYSFAVTPGHYVLRATFPPPANVKPFVEVTVSSGQRVNVDIPNMCK